MPKSPRQRKAPSTRAPSIRDDAHRAALLYERISTLKIEEPISYASFEKWVSKEGIKGRTFYENLKRLGFWSEQGMVELLREHGFIEVCIPFMSKVDQFINGNRAVVGKLLAEFLGELIREEKKDFGPKDLDKWKSKEGRSGLTLRNWVYNHGGFNHENIESLLAEVGEAALLAICPVSIQEKGKWNWGNVSQELKDYVRKLTAGESWTLNKFEASDKKKRGPIVGWIERQDQKMNPEWMAKLFEGEESLLKSNPFEQKRFWNKPMLWKYIHEFLEKWPIGKVWSAKRIWEWEKSKDGTKGVTIYAAVQRLYGDGGGRINWRKMIADAGVDLVKYPFEYREVNFWESKIDDVFGEFLKDHPVGKTLAPKDLLVWIAEDGTTGAQLHDHLCKKRLKEEGGIDWDWVLKRQPESLRKEHPFEKREYWTEERETLYLSQFLDQLEEGMNWSYRTLSLYKPKRGTKGISFYSRISEKYRTPDNKVDWLYILLKLVPEKYLERNPFTYRGVDFWKGRSASRSNSREDIGTANFGRGVIDESARDAEVQQIDEEEVEEYHSKRQLIRAAIRQLSEDERELLVAYQKGEEVEVDEVNRVLQKLRDLTKGD